MWYSFDMDTNKPTHRFEAIVTIPGRERPVRVTTKVVGIADEAVRAAIVKVLDYNSIPSGTFTITKLRTSKLPAPSTKLAVRRLNNHDYVTVTVILADGRANLTWSRYREQVSGTLVRHALTKRVLDLMTKARTGSVGDLATKFVAAGERALKSATKDFATFVSLLEQEVEVAA